MDTVDIHCPFYNDTVTRDEAEYSLIYSVSKNDNGSFSFMRGCCTFDEYGAVPWLGKDLGDPC